MTSSSLSPGDFTPERKKSSLLGREGKGERDKIPVSFFTPSAHMSHVVLTYKDAAYRAARADVLEGFLNV